jgi:3-oxoadipate enol-lactonase
LCPELCNCGLHIMKRCTINGTTISFVDRGSGPVLLLAHGFPLDHSMWIGQIKPLSARYRVIAPDLRGFGKSKVTEGVVTMEQFADDLAALLDYLAISEPAVLCGLSMGGYVALAFWRKYAQRLRGLIFCDTRAANDSPETAAARLVLAQRVTSEGTRGVADTMVPRLFAPSTLQRQPHFIEDTRQVIEQSDPRSIAATARGMAQRSDFTAEMHDITCPVLFIVGTSDVITPVDEMQQMARAVPNAQFSVVEHAGHMAPLEQPDIVNATIESFLKLL